MNKLLLIPLSLCLLLTACRKSENSTSAMSLLRESINKPVDSNAQSKDKIVEYEKPTPLTDRPE